MPLCQTEALASYALSVIAYSRFFSGGNVVLWSVLTPIIILIILIAIINLIQNKKKEILPTKLQTWEWVPEPMRSLRPYDNFMTGLPCCKSCRDAAKASEDQQLDDVKVELSARSSRSNSVRTEKSRSNSELSDKKGVENPGFSVNS